MLMPTIGSPLAQWALGNEAGHTPADRSGNGRDLSGSMSGGLFQSGVAVPDLTVKHYALGNVASPFGSISRTDAALRLTGAMTVALRASLFNLTGRIEQVWLACAGSGVQVEDENCLYALGARWTGTQFVLRYRAEQGAGVDISFVSTLAMRPGAWFFVALRRSEAGVVTLTLGDPAGNTDEQSGALAPPTGGGNAVFRIADDNVNGPFCGAVKDIGLWDHELSGAELATLRSAALSELL